MTRDELTELFAGLGADNPQGWANSQIDEGIPQLHRYVFLRQAWQSVLDPGNPHWIDNLRRDQSVVTAPARDALERSLATGAAPADLEVLIRHMQRELLFSVCCLLGDPGSIEPEVDGVSWGLFVTDADGDPIAPLEMLHESVIATDPLGSEYNRS